jgi:hypothetical protein
MSESLLISIIILTIILVCIIACRRTPAMYCDDYEEETVTTTTIRNDSPNIVGNLKRQAEGTQSFILDPVDSQKIWLNSNDEMYEDADGKIWRLV